MDPSDRRAVVAELQEAFGAARDVTPAPDQPLHVALDAVLLAEGWSPSPARALVRFTNWPSVRPEFFISTDVVNSNGDPPRSNSTLYVLGEAWRQFSWTFDWPTNPSTAVTAMHHWLSRFREST